MSFGRLERPADATLGWPGACPSCPAGGGGEPRVELPAPRLLRRRDCHEMPLQAVGRLVAHGLDRRHVLNADMARLQQPMGGIVAALDWTSSITAINAHPLEKVKRAVSAVGECGNIYFLHPRTCLQRRLKQGLVPMHQALQKSKCGNAA
jgi:hypothetical protein